VRISSYWSKDTASNHSLWDPCTGRSTTATRVPRFIARCRSTWPPLLGSVASAAALSGHWCRPVDCGRMTEQSCHNLTRPAKPWCRQKLIVSQVIKNLLAFYGTRSFIAVFTRIRYPSLSRPIPATNLRSVYEFFMLWCELRASYGVVGVHLSRFSA
jgi:hypothetical protein